MNWTGAFFSPAMDGNHHAVHRQKNRDGLGWFARRASAWLLKKVKERMYVRGQANEETCKISRNWKVRVPGEVSTSILFLIASSNGDQDFGSERLNDSLIIDCCKYFRRGRRTFLCSADKNLCIESESESTGMVYKSHGNSTLHISVT
jgi:hypothetical protein